MIVIYDRNDPGLYNKCVINPAPSRVPLALSRIINYTPSVRIQILASLTIIIYNLNVLTVQPNGLCLAGRSCQGQTL